MTIVITARIDEELAHEIEEYMKNFKVDRSTAIKMILSLGIRDWKTQKALKLYKALARKPPTLAVGMNRQKKFNKPSY